MLLARAALVETSPPKAKVIHASAAPRTRCDCFNDAACPNVARLVDSAME
jgi:hypothetical protein